VSKYVDMIGHDDAPHLNPPNLTVEEREELFADMLPHERIARETGRPSLGAGAIYPVPEDKILIDPFVIPDHYEMGYAIDPGWNVTAALLGARNTETDQVYIVAEYYGQRDEPIIHSHGIKAMLPWNRLVGAIDPAAEGANQKDGSKLKVEYEDLGLELMYANNAVAAGLRHNLVGLSGGTVKVFNTLLYFQKEFRLYRRNEKGKIIKQNDHLMDCFRYLLNTPGAFQPRPIQRNTRRRRSGGEW